LFESYGETVVQLIVSAGYSPRAGRVTEMQKIAATALAVAIALITGAIVQVYYSELPPLSAWSAPAVYSFIGVMLLFIVWCLFW
jgi:hypothetical protein